MVHAVGTVGANLSADGQLERWISASTPDHTCDDGDCDQWPNDRNPIFFEHPARTPTADTRLWRSWSDAENVRRSAGRHLSEGSWIDAARMAVRRPRSDRLRRQAANRRRTSSVARRERRHRRLARLDRPWCSSAPIAAPRAAPATARTDHRQQVVQPSDLISADPSHLQLTRHARTRSRNHVHDSGIRPTRTRVLYRRLFPLGTDDFPPLKTLLRRIFRFPRRRCQGTSEGRRDRRTAAATEVRLLTLTGPAEAARRGCRAASRGTLWYDHCVVGVARLACRSALIDTARRAGARPEGHARHRRRPAAADRPGQLRASARYGGRDRDDRCLPV